MMAIFQRKGAKAQSMVEEFIRVFPGRCMICSYWRFGRRNCLTTKATPAHECIETVNPPPRDMEVIAA